MKVSDLIRVKKMEWMDAPGYFLLVMSVEPHQGVKVLILSGPRFGQQHVIYPHTESKSREFEVISESR
jgi:hypothetical protein